MKPFPLPFAPPLTLLAVLAALSFGASSAAAELQQETRAMAAFHRIEIDGQVNVTLVQGAAPAR